MTDLESRLRSYVAPDDDEDRGEIRALMVEAAEEIAAMRKALDEAHEAFDESLAVEPDEQWTDNQKRAAVRIGAIRTARDRFGLPP